MFFQETTPDTSGYMIAGYTIAFLVMALYVVSMYLRSRNLHRDMDILEDMEKSVSPPAQAVPKGEPKKKSSRRSGNNKSAKPVTKKSRKK